MIRAIGTTLAAAVLFLVAGCSDEAPAPPPAADSVTVAEEPSYRLTIDSDGTSRMPDGTSPLRFETETSYVYTWRQTGRRTGRQTGQRTERQPGSEAELILHSIRERSALNGVEQSERFMTRDHFRSTEGESSVDVEYEEANPELKRMLADSFEKPLVRLVLNERGQPIDAEIVAHGGARETVSRGVIRNTRIFHVPFADRPRWHAPCSVHLPFGGTAQGRLRYEVLETLPDERGDLVDVRVSGNLLASGRDSDEQRNARFQVSGRQRYDRRVGAWVSGELTMHVTFDTYLADELFATNEGRIVLTLEVEQDS